MIGIISQPPVHPRVCGEHVRVLHRLRVIVGSSPRVRGTHESVSPSRKHCRFIPACAGNTLDENNDGILSKVHPRVCGEHVVFLVRYRRVYGSSPRVRGTLQTVLVQLRD